MTAQNTSPAALRKIAIIFASICCTTAAVGVATPLLAAGSATSGLAMGNVVAPPIKTAQASGDLVRTGANV
jgi:hypothetical protein